MKKILALLALSVALPGAPALAYESNPGSARQCFREQYREEYIPGNADRKGRVKSWIEKVEVPCSPRRSRPDRTARPRPRPQTRPAPVDDNSCIEGSILGGLAGGAAGAALSQDEGMIYGIPLGIIGGVLVGCQIDGG